MEKQNDFHRRMRRLSSLFVHSLSCIHLAKMCVVVVVIVISRKWLFASLHREEYPLIYCISSEALQKWLPLLNFEKDKQIWEAILVLQMSLFYCCCSPTDEVGEKKESCLCIYHSIMSLPTCASSLIILVFLFISTIMDVSLIRTLLLSLLSSLL
jgi:hypothetical protein